MKKLIVFFMAVMIMGLIKSPVQAATQIATITIDGNKGNWALLKPAVIDRENDSACGDSTLDIKSIYTAMDSNNVYFMVETYGTPIDSENTSVVADFDFKPGQQLAWGFRGDISIRVDASGLSAWIDTDLDRNMEPFSIEGAKTAWGDVLEVMIPRSQLGSLTYFEPTHLSLRNLQDDECDSAEIEPDQGIGDMYVQKRNYENGNTFNRLFFSLYDKNHNPLGNVLSELTLLDPNGSVVNIPEPVHYPADVLTGYYDSNSKQWVFHSGFDCVSNEYDVNFNGDLVTGKYRLQVTTSGGYHDERTFKVSQPIELPIISSSTFKAWYDSSNNLIWEWDKPSIASNIRTSISAYIAVDGDDEHYFWISVPTDINQMKIPGYILDLLKARGNKIKMALFLRANDESGNNFQRSISNVVYLDDILTAPPDGNIYTIGFMYIQKRNYENGDTFNRLHFELNDSNYNNNNFAGDVLNTATLVDPNGVEVDISDLNYDPNKDLIGSYDCKNGQWHFDSGFDYFENPYNANFNGDLIAGDYTLKVTTKNGQSLEKKFKASSPVECPIISSLSFRAWKDSTGNLIWEWDPPYAINPDLKTRISVYITAKEDNYKHYIWITLPTHLSGVIVPKNALDKLGTYGKTFELGLFLRVHDEFGNNFQRNASNVITLDTAMAIPPDGDIDNDGKIGLPEAIHALKVITGLNP